MDVNPSNTGSSEYDAVPSLSLKITIPTTGLWVMLFLCIGALFVPLGPFDLSQETLKNLGTGLIMGAGFSIWQIVSARKQNAQPLRLSAKGIQGPKGIDVPAEQIQDLQLTDKVFSFRRGKGGKKYMWPRSVFSPEDQSKLAAWVAAWNARCS
jgi:hypothetical protein